MSDTMIAAALGLVIPVVATSICKRLWTHGLAVSRGRRRPNGGLLTVGFAVEVAALLAASYAFKRVASSMRMEAEHFDPYQILDLPLKANSTVIKSQYRRLSLKHHPDKNPGNRGEASKKFDQVAKAYKALSNPEARRNWELYGHPDGYQPWTFDLALPGWLRPGKDTDNATLALYAAGYMAVIVGFILSVKLGLNALDPVGRVKKSAYKITEEDVQSLLRSLDDTSSVGDVLECLAASPRLCSEDRRTLAEEMEPTTAPVREMLLSSRDAAALLRTPHPPATPPTPATLHTTTGKSGRKGKGKGKGPKKAKRSGGNGSTGDSGGEVDGARAPESTPTPEVEGEYFSRGRKGEENRRETRLSPERSRVVTHNLIVLLSALHRVDAPRGAVGCDDDLGTDSVESTETRPNLEPKAEEKGAYSDENVAEGRQERDDLARLPTASIQFAEEKEVVFGLAEPLLDGCLGVAATRPSPLLFGTVIETKAMLRRRLWSSKDPAALERQRVEADHILDAAVPSIKVKDVVVETWGESQIAVGDTVTAIVTIVREHASEYRGIRRRRPEAGFLAKGEPWWVILASGRGGEKLIGASPMHVENLGKEEVECKMKFQAPRRPGIVPLVVYVKSPVFVGVDCESSSSFRVCRHDELREDEDAGDW